MRQELLERCKQRLLEMGSRLTDEVNRMVEAVPDDLQAQGALSHMPTHLADQAMEGIDKELALIRNEQELQQAVRAALARVEKGTYGLCESCGAEIGEERLVALPFAERCVACAEKAAERSE
ncbi:MAG TPA: TraR/DksA C4-type zinc finger protein [Pirellulales bacterium]|jgi:RNA polymerase-binding protein DksA|nr:TraR/DksA C4-type zinc finger protein [Pirellulales bacterium]